jgi:hypothetical protein
MAATKYEIQASYVQIYTNTTGEVMCGQLSKGTTITATALNGEKNGWLKITDITGSTGGVTGTWKNKYIKIEAVDGTASITSVKNTSGTDAAATTEATSSSSDSIIDNIYTDDAFVDRLYSTYIDDAAYQSQLSEGLRVQDLRGILGMPHQFNALTDPRIDDSEDDQAFGRTYAEKIIKQIPLLLMTPGIPSFMSSYSKAQKRTVIEKVITGVTTAGLDALINESSGKYYSLKYSYTDYFYYVNAMLRSAAYFLEIQDKEVDGKKLGTMNWLYYSNDGSDIFGHEGLSRFLGPYAGAIAFYADAGTTVDDSFSNSTTQSQLSSSLNSLSDQGREMNFLIGNVGSEVGLKVDKLSGMDDLSSQVDSLRKSVDDILGSGNIMSNILNKAQTILAGGRMVFPEIWSDSSFSRSYSCKMKLISPCGSKLSVFLNILVPIYHLLAFCLPRQSIGQSYYSPFLIRAYYKGLFNVDMGIMTGLSITKGAEGEWTPDGIPTVAEVSFEIKDLYDGMFMSKATDTRDINIMSNITELDYIANSCGVNVNDQEVYRTIKMYKALNFTGNFEDKISIGIFANIGQYFNQKMNDLFGVF